MLADKLHNLISIEIALQEGRPVWTAFHAERHEVLWYYHAMLDRCDDGDPRLESLAGQCRDRLARIEAMGG